MRAFLLTAALTVSITVPSHAAVQPVNTLIDFENASSFYGLEEGDTITDQFLDDFGVSFSSPQTSQLAEQGDPLYGFVGSRGRANDTTDPASRFGNFFLTTIFEGPLAELEITYADPVDALSFDIADVDGPEVFTIEAYSIDAVLLATQTITAGDPGTGDRIATRVGFEDLAAPISRVELSGVRHNGTIGIAFDNFDVSRNIAAPPPTPTPLPGAFGFFVSGIAGLWWARRGRLKALPVT